MLLGKPSEPLLRGLRECYRAPTSNSTYLMMNGYSQSGLGTGLISSIGTNPSDNYQSTLDTIQQMKSLVIENQVSPIVEQAVQQILHKVGTPRGLPASDVDLVRATYWWVKHHIHFTIDEVLMTDHVHGLGIDNLESGKELLLSPSFLLTMDDPRGDCDDFSTLLATLLVKEGFKQVAFCTVAADGNEPNNFTHVYVKVVLGDGTVLPLDASHGQYPGWETSSIYRSVDWII